MDTTELKETIQSVQSCLQGVKLIYGEYRHFLFLFFVRANECADQFHLE